jgi:hypothetical protein
MGSKHITQLLRPSLIPEARGETLEHSSSLLMFVKKSEAGKNPQDFLLGEIFGKCQNEKLNVKCTLLHVEIYKLFHTEINLQFDLIIFYQGVKI